MNIVTQRFRTQRFRFVYKFRITHQLTHIGKNYQFDQKNVSLKIFVLTFRLLCGHDFHKFLKTFSDVRESNIHFIIFKKILKKTGIICLLCFNNKKSLKLCKNVVKIFNNNPNFFSIFIVKITNPRIIYILSFYIF